MFLFFLGKQLPPSTKLTKWMTQSIVHSYHLNIFGGRCFSGLGMSELVLPQRRALSFHVFLSLLLFLVQFLGGRDSRGPYLADITLLLVEVSMISLVHISRSPNFTLNYSISCSKFQTNLKVLWIIYQPNINFLQQVLFDSLACNIILCQIWKALWKVYSQAKQSKLCLLSFESFFFLKLPQFHHKKISNKAVFCSEIAYLPTYMYT